MKEVVRDLTLLLLYLTSWDEKIPGGSIKRSWKGYPFDALNELQKKGYISGSMKAKSVYLSDKGIAFAKKMVSKYSKVEEYEAQVSKLSRSAVKAGVISEEDIDKAVHKVKRVVRDKKNNR